MNALQAIQTVRGALQLGTAVHQKRSLGDVVGAVAGTAFAAQTGGVGSIASGLVEDVTAAVVDGVVAGVTGVVDTTTTAGKAIAAYTSGGMKTLGKVVDFFV
ncbi:MULTISPECIES: hypothetical protein [Comamonadaceae]|jgi:hypothetical protein|uniref:hypothetical protein n=1 Tax=Comamonadaceae TaxID=80864 RepID=UPI001B5044EB|nr:MULTISPECIES: hypothetical protein [Comamonas]MBP7352271.1 hypothetical protein [Comamonas sp.]MBV7418550.1 hypothetical protein [Comamonas sp. CMM03]MDH0050021.1 hypothetical protein [Comamonas terrigena]MDH0512755.1 hypothetical protein [Comamonas terrigena]MDH1092600.1 hypothetical protein [Comamonas terrigena]